MITPTMDYPSCWDLALIATLQLLAEGLGRVAFTGKSEIKLRGNITDA